MRRIFLAICGFALFSATPSFVQPSRAQQSKFRPPDSLLPKQFSNWHRADCAAKPPEFGFDKESGERDFSSCSYTSGNNTVQIFLGQYRDPSSAYEIFTSRLRSGMVPTNLGQAAAFDKRGVVFQEGALVVESSANISKDDLNALVQAIGAESEKGPLPPVRSYLPANRRVLGTERYALGPDALTAALKELGQTDTAGLVNAAGFSTGVEAMVARYSNGGKDHAVLLLLEYPTPQLAEQHIHHLDEILPSSARQGDRSIVRKGSLLSIVLSPSSPEYAKALREDADYETHVTWNEASQTATDPPWSSILSKIFIGTAIFMISAVVLGIAFGGLRVITKRLFPGKVFDRPGQIEVLQLGLSSKPIDPKDLY